jgi:flavin-dependent dehydrogenase
MIYDYIIIGAGPAGATTAFSLQKLGAHCLVLEKEASLKEKICGGLLTYSALSSLSSVGMCPDELLELGAVKFHHFACFSGDESVVHSYHAGEYGIGTARAVLDNWLLRKAAEQGAEVQYGINVQTFSENEGLYKIGDYLGKRLVFATGARGYCSADVRKCLAGQTFGLSAQIGGTTNLSPEYVYFWYINHEGEYFWCIPIRKGLWNIGIWFHDVPSSPATVFHEYRKQFIDSAFSSYQYVLPLRGAFCGNVDLSASLPNGCYGVGDFAGCNDSSTGEGLRYAIESAIQFADERGG